MIRVFKQSKRTAVGIFIGALCLSVALWIHNQGRPVWITVIATVLLLLIGLFVGKLAGNIVANTQNVKRLGILHVDLDPEAFAAAYAEIPGKLKEGCRDQKVCRTYLADGYAAGGNFQKALEILDKPRDTDEPALRGLLWQSRCACQLGLGQAEEADRSLKELEAVAEGCRAGKGALYENLDTSAKLLRSRLALLTGHQPDQVWLEDQLSKATYQLRRLDIQQMLAQLALNEGDKEKAAALKKEIQDHGGKTWYAAWAKTE